MVLTTAPILFIFIYLLKIKKLKKKTVWREHIEGTIKFNRLWQATKVVEYMLNTLDPVSSAFGVQPSLSAVPKTATAESEADETTILAVAMGLLLAPRLGSAASYLTPTEYITSTEVVTTGESILGTWAVISINKRDEQQDRVILLSSAAFYRVKLKSRGRAVDHFTRIALEDIDHLQKGAFTVRFGDVSFVSCLVTRHE